MEDQPALALIVLYNVTGVLLLAAVNLDFVWTTLSLARAGPSPDRSAGGAGRSCGAWAGWCRPA